MILLNDKPLQLDTAFTHDGLNYPANWLRIASIEEKSAIGIIEVPDPEEFDNRFYWSHNNPKDLDQLKTQWIKEINNIAFSLLSPTDWMIIRKMERKIKIPSEIVDYRQNVITECDRLSELINNVTDVEQLIEIINSQVWPSNPNNPII